MYTRVLCSATVSCANSPKDYGLLSIQEHLMYHLKDQGHLAQFEYACASCRGAYFSNRMAMFAHKMQFQDHQIVRLELDLDNILENEDLKEAFFKTEKLFSQITREEPNNYFPSSPCYSPPPPPEPMFVEWGTQTEWEPTEDEEDLEAEEQVYLEELMRFPNYNRSPTPTGDLYPIVPPHIDFLENWEPEIETNAVPFETETQPTITFLPAAPVEEVRGKRKRKPSSEITRETYTDMPPSVEGWKRPRVQAPEFTSWESQPTPMRSHRQRA